MMFVPAFLFLLGVTTISCTTTTTTTTTTPATTEEAAGGKDGGYISCRYWCVYKRPYCCDDGSLIMPEDHRPHRHLQCPEMDEQICKSTGIFLNNTNPSMVLAKGNPKKQVWCASDGYCQEDQVCCPSPCVRRHLCLAGLKRDQVPEEEVELYEGEQMAELEMEDKEYEYLPEEEGVEEIYTV